LGIRSSPLNRFPFPQVVGSERAHELFRQEAGSDSQQTQDKLFPPAFSGRGGARGWGGEEPPAPRLFILCQMESVPYNGLAVMSSGFITARSIRYEKKRGPWFERGPRFLGRMARANKGTPHYRRPAFHRGSRKLEVRLDVMLGAQQPRPERRHERVVAELHEHRSAA